MRSFYLFPRLLLKRFIKMRHLTNACFDFNSCEGTKKNTKKNVMLMIGPKILKNEKFYLNIMKNIYFFKEILPS